MRNIYAFLLLGFAMLLGGCQATEITFHEGDERELAHLLNKKALKFEATRVEPLARQTLVATTDGGNLQRYGSYSGLVDVNGYGFYLTLEGDHVKAILPYYSQKERFENYAGRDWIELDMPISDLRYYHNRSRRIADILFEAQDLTEPFTIRIRLFGNRKGIITVYSPHRDRISYYGKVREHVVGR